MKPSKYLFIPFKDGRWLRDSQGKPRIYKSASMALNYLKRRDYDTMQVFAIDDVMSRESFEQYYVGRNKSDN